jgi:hypothetical protein
MMEDEEIRESAEDISHQRRRVTDLKTHINVLRTLHHKVQSIIHAHFTHNALQTVNNAIKRSNISKESMDNEQGKLANALVPRWGLQKHFYFHLFSVWPQELKRWLTN